MQATSPVVALVKTFERFNFVISIFMLNNAEAVKVQSSKVVPRRAIKEHKELNFFALKHPETRHLL